MTRLAHPVDAPVADDPADAVISGGKVLADGFRRYERFHVIRGNENAPRPIDVLRSGPAAAVLPVAVFLSEDSSRDSSHRSAKQTRTKVRKTWLTPTIN